MGLKLLRLRFPRIAASAGLPDTDPTIADEPAEPTEHFGTFFDYARWVRSLSNLQMADELTKAESGEPLDQARFPSNDTSAIQLKFQVALDNFEQEFLANEMRQLGNELEARRIEANLRRRKRLVSASATRAELIAGLKQSEERTRAAESKVRELEEELATLRARPKAPNSLNPKLEATYQKMILGMAVDKFQYRPQGRSSAAENIRSALLRHGFKLDAKTIRDRLSDAVTAIEPE